MFDHLTVKVRDVQRSRAFYERVLAPLGYAVQMEHGGAYAFGPRDRPVFWLAGDAAHATPPMHLAFEAPNRAAVDAFHRAAIAAGAKDNGGPGLREQYHPTYYAAFVFDPDGHPIEAVCHGPA